MGAEVGACPRGFVDGQHTYPENGLLDSHGLALEHHASQQSRLNHIIDHENQSGFAVRTMNKIEPS